MYHINPETGNPGVCKAKIKCRFGIESDGHYSSKEEAREAYERSQSEATFVNSNETTLESYDSRVDEYIAGSPFEVSASMAKLMDESFSQLPEGARIVELGAAFGRDSRYLMEKGFDVVSTDGSEGFMEYLNKSGLKATKVDILNDRIPYADGVLANAVFLHFNKEEAELGFRKVSESLPENGVFALTLKEGEGEEMSNEKIDAPRYFRYWKEDEVRESLVAAGFSNVAIEKEAFGPVSWLQISATKREDKVEESYLGSHQPHDDGVQGHDVELFFPDFYEHPEYYRTGDDKSDRESVAAMMRMRENPEQEVTIYRSVPKKEFGIVPGNWVTLSPNYAKGHGDQFLDQGPEWETVSMKVKAKDIRSPGDSINEWGYFPESS